MSKNILLCTVASVALATSSAFAADMPAKAPLTPPPPAWSWTGFYVGAHGGYGWKRNDFQEFLGTVGGVDVFVGGVDSSGWVAGGQFGYNWQSGSFVGGLELDMSATGINGTSTPAVLNFGGGVTQTVSREDDVKWLGSARARLGWTPQTTAWPFWLYATGGLAWERFQRINTTATVALPIVQNVTTTIPNDRFGWVVGVGGEVRVSGNWLARLEYLHYEFGTSDTSTVVTSSVGGSFAETNHNQKIDVVRAGLSYKFGPDPSSPLAAYAAGMPVKAAAVSPAPWSWAGFYVGAHGGYGWKRNDFQEFLGTIGGANFFVGDVDSNGWVAGGQFGYNWQRGSFVGGVELDMSATGINGSSTTALAFGGGVTQTISREDDVKWLGSARARLGWTPQTTAWPFWLYATGGLAWERFERADTTVTIAPGITQTVVTTRPNDRFGWVVGVGGEARLSGNWLARLEYLHYEFGTSETSTVVTSNVGGSFAETNGNQKIDVVRAGLSYKFGPDPSSPLAAYAADMPVKGAPVSPAAPAWTWTGFYVGAHGGYGWKRNDFQEFLGTVGGVDVFVGDVDSSGWVAGGQFGYNWQKGWFVGGIELDMSATGVDGTSTPAFLSFGGGVTQTVSREDDVKWLGSARARLGWTPRTTAWPFWLYATGGLAWERFQRINTTVTLAPGIAQTVTTTIPNDRFGWVVGVGGEVRVSGNWLARLEYLHYEFGTSETPVVVTQNAPGSFAETSRNQKINVVRAGVSYKF